MIIKIPHTYEQRIRPEGKKSALIVGTENKRNLTVYPASGFDVLAEI